MLSGSSVCGPGRRCREAVNHVRLVSCGHREVRLIQDVYHDQTGRSVDVSDVVLAVEAYVANTDVLTELSIAAGSMPQGTK